MGYDILPPTGRMSRLWRVRKQRTFGVGKFFVRVFSGGNK
jgi:hypothetical protein